MALNIPPYVNYTPAPKPAAKPSTKYMSADAIANSPSIVGKKAAASERKAMAAAVARSAAAKAAAAPRIYESADAIAMSPTLVGPEAAASEAAARQAAEQRMAAPKVQYRTSGSGRNTSDVVGGGGASAPAVAPIFVPPEAVTAPPAVVQPPAVVAEAAPSETNVPGESFTTVGAPGSFGAYERRRATRGPRSGLSVTPEMLRRAASQRLG